MRVKVSVRARSSAMAYASESVRVSSMVNKGKDGVMSEVRDEGSQAGARTRVRTHEGGQVWGKQGHRQGLGWGHRWGRGEWQGEGRESEGIYIQHDTTRAATARHSKTERKTTVKWHSMKKVEERARHDKDGHDTCTKKGTRKIVWVKNNKGVQCKSDTGHEKTARNDHGTARAGTATARHLRKKRGKENDVSEEHWVNKGVRGTNRDSENGIRREGAKEENINRQIPPVIIKRQNTNNHAKIRRSHLRSQTHHKKHKQRRKKTKQHVN